MTVLWGWVPKDIRWFDTTYFDDATFNLGNCFIGFIRRSIGSRVCVRRAIGTISIRHTDEIFTFLA